jgi:hypothetical protein
VTPQGQDIVNTASEKRVFCRVFVEDASCEEEGVEWRDEPKKNQLFLFYGSFQTKAVSGLEGCIAFQQHDNEAPCLSNLVLELLSADLMFEDPFFWAGTPTNKHPRAEEESGGDMAAEIDGMQKNQQKKTSSHG